MPIIDSGQPYFQPGLVDQYWRLVKEALTQLFRHDPTYADALRQAIDKRPAQEQLLFYHTEPFRVAATIAGRRLDRGLDMEHVDDRNLVERYIELAARFGWGSP